jgi:transglutaminase-like putative cysteine protease
VIADRSAAIVFVWIYAISCLWWLVSMQWERVVTCPASKVERLAFRRGFSILLAAACGLSGMAAVGGRWSVWRRLHAEWMPTSGGTTLADPASRSGVGDGDVLVAATQHGLTFGAVETDFYLDSDKPSLFDMYSEEYGEVRKRKTEYQRAVAVKPEQDMQQEKRVAEGNRESSDRFSTDRNTPHDRPTPNDLESAAIMYWRGRPNTRLAVERFDRFDGIEWSKSLPAGEARKPDRVTLAKTVWFQDSQPQSEGPFVHATPAAIKFTRYDSNVIPSSSGLKLWRIDEVDRESFFAHNAQDCLLLADRRSIPEYTVVRMIDREIDIEYLESAQPPLADRQRSAAEVNQSARQSTTLRPMVEELARRWAADQPRGWRQITEVIDHLRSEYRLGRSEVPADSDAITPLEQFLRSGQGSDIQFATAASEVLRRLGYRTRFVTGFFIPQQDSFIPVDELPITPDHLHVWIELEVADHCWIPLEANPGYPAPDYSASLLYRLKRAAPRLACLSGLIGGTIGLVWWLRRGAFQLICRAMWWLTIGWSDRRRVVWLMWILDTRSRIAGHRRPLEVTPRSWYTRQSSGAPLHLRESLHQFFLDADRLWFGAGQRLSHEGKTALRRLWTDPLAECLTHTTAAARST